jgi:TIR domain
MIVVLYQRGCQKTAKSAAADLREAFANHVKVALIAASSSSSWPAEISWDFPATGTAFITQYLKERSPSAVLLPVAIDPATQTPPTAVAAIKALEYDRAAKGPKGRLVNRVGGMLGLRVQGRDSKIFISYRARDGSVIAEQLYAHLISLGHSPFLDKAEELDGETKIIPGSPVQKQIDDALDRSNLVLLIDTPSAPDSRWIMHEVETADSLLLPILPICFRAKDDSKRGPRFRSLVELQRWVPLQLPDPSGDPPLNAGQLDEIVSEAEQYMCEIFRRKCRVPFIVEKEFVSRGFAWKVLDQRLLMYESSKSSNWRVRTKVLSQRCPDKANAG